MCSILSLEMPLAQFSPPRMSPASLAHGSSPTDSVGAYSLGSDGFPRPSRRATDRRSTIQTTTSMSRSSASRKSTQLSDRSRTGTHSSLHRQSVEGAARRSGSASGSYQSQYHRPASHDGHGQRAYTRTPTSLRTGSVPTRHVPIPGTPYY